MSTERGDALRDAIIGAIAIHGGSKTLDAGVARAICEHLGVEVLRETVGALNWTASGFNPGTVRYDQWRARADAIATLLEAADIDKD